jgi:protein tyrosine/serine phosphatase
VTDPANSPVYIHCASANRVGAMWLIKRVVDDGWDVDRATQEAERIGLTSRELKQFALDYIQRRQG